MTTSTATKFIIRAMAMTYLGYQAGKDEKDSRVPVWAGDVAVAVSLVIFVASLPSVYSMVESLAVLAVLSTTSLPCLKRHRVMGSGDAKAYTAIYLSAFAAFEVPPLLILGSVGFLASVFFINSAFIRRIKKTNTAQCQDNSRAPFFPSLFKAYSTICIASIAIL